MSSFNMEDLILNNWKFKWETLKKVKLYPYYMDSFEIGFPIKFMES